MANLEGKTPDQMAAEIMAHLQEKVYIEISGPAADMLNIIIRYKEAKKIYSKGEKWFQANLETLQTEWLETIIKAQHTQREKADAKQEETEKLAAVKLLISRGVNRYKALEMAGMLTAEDVDAQKKIDEANAAKAKELQEKAAAELAASAKAAAEKAAKK